MIIINGYNDMPCLIAFEGKGMWLTQYKDQHLNNTMFDILVYPTLEELINLRDSINTQIKKITGV